MNKEYLPYFERLDEKYKQIFMSWDKEKLIDHLVANIHNGEVLLERIDKAKEYMEQNYSAIVGRIEKIYKILDKGDYND